MKKAKTAITDKEARALSCIMRCAPVPARPTLSIWLFSSIICPNEPRTTSLRRSNVRGDRRSMYEACPVAARIIKSLCRKKLAFIDHWTIRLTDEGRKHGEHPPE